MGDEEAPLWRWLHNEGREVEGQRRREGSLESGHHHVGGLNERRSRIMVSSSGVSCGERCALSAARLRPEAEAGSKRGTS